MWNSKGKTPLSLVTPSPGDRRKVALELAIMDIKAERNLGFNPLPEPVVVIDEELIELLKQHGAKE